MRIVIGNHFLGAPGGTETYTITVATHLQRLGHEVWIDAAEQGALADASRAQGLRVPERPSDLPREIDAAVANDGMSAVRLAARYPAVPLVLVGHSDTFEMALPPRLPDLLSGIVVLYDRVERRVRGMDLGLPITRLAQPIDLERFQSLRPLPQRAETVLVMGNYTHGERLGVIERACARAGLTCRQIGDHGEAGRVLDPVEALSAADVVIGKARVIVEAMAAGRAVYVYDHNGGDGWVTADSYAVQAADNFGGQATPLIIDEDRLAADLTAYDPAMGLINRDLAVAHHAATAHAADLAQLLAGLAPRPAPVPAPLDEIARLIRTTWQHQGEAFVLHRTVQRLELRLQAIDREHRAATQAHDAAVSNCDALTERALAADARAEHADARAELADARAEQADARADAAELAAAAATADAEAARRAAAHHLATAEAFRATRRYRLAGALAAPLDRLRARKMSG